MQDAKDDLLEELADAEHASWSHWMAYLFSKCVQNEDGSMTIPKDLVERWREQVETPYAELSEPEKESDRDEVRKILPLISRWAAAESAVKVGVRHT